LLVGVLQSKKLFVHLQYSSKWTRVWVSLIGVVLMFETKSLLTVGIIVVMIFSAYFDCAQLFARLSHEARSKVIVLSIANWWQYISRLCNVGFAAALAVAYEMNFNFQLSDILIVGYFCSSVVVFSSIKSKLNEYLVSKYGGFVIFLPSRELKYHRYWRKLDKPKLIHILPSLGHAICLQVAILSPLFLADLFPNFRMSAVYLGQFITFTATFYLMVYIDPLINNNIDTQQPIGFADGLIYGRFFALLSILFALLFMRFY
jgi:hypothetical protein